MSDYTPTQEEMRTDYIMAYDERGGSQLLAGMAFDRAIAKVKADARDETIDFISRHYEDYLPAEWSWKVEKDLRGKHE